MPLLPLARASLPVGESERDVRVLPRRIHSRERDPFSPGEKVRMRVFPPSAKNAEMGMRELGVMSLPALQ
jgi:hypothetical protein